MAGDFSAIAGNKRLAPHTTGEIHHLRESDKNPNAKAPERKVVPAVMNVSGKYTNASDFFSATASLHQRRKPSFAVTLTIKMVIKRFCCL